MRSLDATNAPAAFTAKSLRFLLTFKCCLAILLMAFLRFRPPFFRLETLLCSRLSRFCAFLK